ncbi:MAG TPA: hypothetical protein VFU43_30700 [Streptosporangiaceae bacterium]|nr:hypothetical protein [Streptosporangiaceae bacterium]
MGLARRYGSQPVDAACGRALELDVISVTKIAAMLAQAAETTPVITERKIARGGPGPVRPRPGRVRDQPARLAARAVHHRCHAGNADDGTADQNGVNI